MDPVCLQYAPATTRTMMSRVGAFVTVEIDGEPYRLSPHEMPGEIEWRIDFVRWLILRTFLQLSALRPTERTRALIQIEQDLIRKTNLHPFEAEAVAQGVLVTFDDAEGDDASVSEHEGPRLAARVTSEGDALMGRYIALVKQYGRRKEHGAEDKRSWALPADWNWSQLLDW